MIAFACLALFAAFRFPQLPRDSDTDRDGLTDFAEVHKHFTDPKKADSDGDGIPDGDWDERREFYREWANQDVSEAVFEKSRDPR